MQSTHDAGRVHAAVQAHGQLFAGLDADASAAAAAGGNNSDRAPIPASIQQKTADYLASINLSNAETIEFPLKTLPRPKGRSTRVIITEYDLPRKDAQPHDVVMDTDGKVWYSDFSHQFIGELDPATGKVTDYPNSDAAAGGAEGLARSRARSAGQSLARR